MEEKTITCSTEHNEDDIVVWFKATNEKPEPAVVEKPYKSFDPVEDASIPEPKVELLTPEEYEKRKAELMAEAASMKAEAASTTESLSPADSD
jgi:inorganic pyrophosphatase/exopolyphosphatase